MKNLAKYLFMILSTLLLSEHSYADDIKEAPLLKFGVIADIQYCDCETRGTRFYSNSLRKLEDCIEDLNKEKVEFTVNLGDLVDRDTPSNLDSVIVRLQRLDNRVYNTTGNHDYGGITDNKALYDQLGMPHSYYSFSRGNWVIVMLNTNEISSYAITDNPEAEAELAAMREQVKNRTGKAAASYNGGVGKRQLQWLHGELEEAKKASKNVLVFTHHPLYAVAGLMALDDKEVVELLSAYTCVKAVVSGHHHAGAYGEYEHIPYITTEGMIETESENAYGIAEIYRDRIEFIGKGRSKSYSIEL